MLESMCYSDYFGLLVWFGSYLPNLLVFSARQRLMESWKGFLLEGVMCSQSRLFSILVLAGGDRSRVGSSLGRSGLGSKHN